MATLPPYRAPVPLFIPALSAALVLLVLFVFGVREQQHLAEASSEQIISQRAEIARIVAEAIESDLRAAEASARRFAPARILLIVLVLSFLDLGQITARFTVLG